MRGRAILATFLVILAVAGYLLIGAGSPIIEAIKVKGGGRIGTSNIQAQSGLRLGDPWSASQRESAISAILDFPQVEDVSVAARRVSLKSVAVEIDVAEREPFGVLSVDGRGFYWADRQGVLIDPVEGATYLPIISNIPFEESSKGIQSSIALNAYQEFYALPGSVLSQYREVEFHGQFLELIRRDDKRLKVPVAGLRDSLDKAEVLLLNLEEAEIGDWRVIDLRFGGEVTLAR